MKIQKIITCLLFMLLGFESFGQCPDANIYLETQGAVDSFNINHPNCHSLLKSLFIRPALSQGLSDITNLSGLTGITEIEQGLIISKNPDLNDLQGLENLNYIGGSLNVSNNKKIKNLNPLSNAVNGASGWLSIMNNDSLENLMPLNGASFINVEISGNNNLQYLADSIFTSTNVMFFIIEDNPKLLSLNGLNNTQFVIGVRIENNDALSNFNGLENLWHIGWEGLRIIDNDALLNLHGLEGLLEVSYAPEDPGLPSGTDIIIKDNDVLQNLEGMGTLIDAFSLDIINNNTLTSLQGLENQTLIQKLYVVDNDSLLDLTGLIPINQYEGLSLTIETNPQLSTLHGLEAFDKFNNLYIGGNNALINLNGLENLVDVRNALSITNHQNLADISALHQLATAKEVYISGNDSLTSLIGFANDTAQFELVKILNNPNLPVCEAESICNFLRNFSPEDNTVEISNNAPGCNSRTEVEAACMIDATKDLIVNSGLIHISPNPAAAFFEVRLEEESQERLEDIRAFNAFGQLVYRVKPYSFLQKIEVSEWTKGLYLVLVNERWVEKVIIE